MTTADPLYGNACRTRSTGSSAGPPGGGRAIEASDALAGSGGFGLGVAPAPPEGHSFGDEPVVDRLAFDFEEAGVLEWVILSAGLGGFHAFTLAQR